MRVSFFDMGHRMIMTVIVSTIESVDKQTVVVKVVLEIKEDLLYRVDISSVTEYIISTCHSQRWNPCML